MAFYLGLALLGWIITASSAISIIPRNNRHRSSQSSIVKTNIATFIGSTNSSYGVDSWLGIHYGKSPTGPLRLQPPVLFNNTGVVEAQQYGDRCFQIGATIANTSENCLVLNIYAPSMRGVKESRNHKYGGLPVMVWIHGGSFNQGSGNNYNGESLVNRSIELYSPVIVVTVNYRLSFFGFSAGTLAMANNALNLGLLDQRLALQWVHSNIAAFGGDPKKVTLFGQSAGASSIGLQITAYNGKCEDLFRAAILESGSPADTLPTPPPTYAPYQQAWDDVVERICTDIFKCVQSADEQLLFTVVSAVENLSALPSSTFPWQQVIDGKFIADFPSKLTAAGKFVKVPMIIGFTTDEITNFVPTVLNITTDSQIEELAQLVFPFIPTTTIQQLVPLDPLSLYPNTFGVGGSQWKRTSEIASDLTKRCPGREWIRNVTKYSPSWKYRLNAIVPSELALAPYEGIVHGSDIAYVFGDYPGRIPNTTADINLSRSIQKAWISFASHLNPNALGPLSPGVSWPRYHNEEEQVLVFQKPDGSAGSPVGQGSFTEKDSDDRPFCDVYASDDPDFLH